MKKKTSRTQKTDRRIIRTRQLLSDALVELILEKGYDAVTIQDIIDRANVGRSTFYMHFESKEQLLVGGHEHFSNLLLPAAAGTKKPVSKVSLKLDSLFEHVAENQKLAKALFGKKAGDVVVGHLRGIVAHNIRVQCKPAQFKRKNDEQVFDMLADSASTAIIAMMVNWIEQDMPFSPEMLSEKADQLARAMLMLR